MLESIKRFKMIQKVNQQKQSKDVSENIKNSK